MHRQAKEKHWMIKRKRQPTEWRNRAGLARRENISFFLMFLFWSWLGECEIQASAYKTFYNSITALNYWRYYLATEGILAPREWSGWLASINVFFMNSVYGDLRRTTYQRFGHFNPKFMKSRCHAELRTTGFLSAYLQTAAVTDHLFWHFWSN